MNEFEKANRESIGTNYIFLLQNFKQNVECVENSTHLDANTKKKRKTHWLSCDMSPFFFGYLEGMLENSKFSLGRGSLTIFMKNIDLCSKNKNNRFEKDFDRRKVLFRKRNGIFSQIRVFLRCQPTRWAEKMQQFFSETNSIFMCRILKHTFSIFFVVDHMPCIDLCCCFLLVFAFSGIVCHYFWYLIWKVGVKLWTFLFFWKNWWHHSSIFFRKSKTCPTRSWFEFFSLLVDKKINQ